MSGRPILVGYDGSEGSRLAVAWALDEAGRTGAPVQLAYAFEWMTTGTWIGPGPGPGAWPDETTRREVEAVVAAAAAEATSSHPGLTVRGEVLDVPATIGLRERSRDASLVVLGSRGHGGFSGLLAGSTTIAVSTHAHCPVVVVRHLATAGAEPAARRRRRRRARPGSDRGGGGRFALRAVGAGLGGRAGGAPVRAAARDPDLGRADGAVAPVGPGSGRGHPGRVDGARRATGRLAGQVSRPADHRRGGGRPPGRCAGRGEPAGRTGGGRHPGPGRLPGAGARLGQPTTAAPRRVPGRGDPRTSARAGQRRYDQPPARTNPRDLSCRRTAGGPGRCRTRPRRWRTHR